MFDNFYQSCFIFIKDERHWVISPSLYPPILCRESKGNNSWTFTKQTQTGKWNGFIALDSFSEKVNRLHGLQCYFIWDLSLKLCHCNIVSLILDTLGKTNILSVRILLQLNRHFFVNIIVKNVYVYNKLNKNTCVSTCLQK